MTLHEAIIKLLKEKGTPMTTTEIAKIKVKLLLFKSMGVLKTTISFFVD